jgi:predicted amidohydrolase
MAGNIIGDKRTDGNYFLITVLRRGRFFMRIALFQNSPEFGRIENNVQKVLDNVEKESFDLLVLPEFFATGYQFGNKEKARQLAEESGHGFTFDKMAALAKNKDALIIYGFPELKGDLLFNSSAAVFPDGMYEIYQKTHLFDLEKGLFEKGQTGFKMVEFKGARVGMMICFDWFYPESTRKLTLLGAQIVAHPSNLVLPHCPFAMKYRALENRVFTVTANRIGDEGQGEEKLHFIGQSKIYSPLGEILGDLGEFEEGFSAAEIAPSLADNKKIMPNSDIIEDMRPEFY